MEFFVVIVPDELQMNQGLRVSLAEKYSMKLSEYDFGQPQRFLVDQLEAFEILVLDLLSSFQNAHLGTSLYRKYDTHWNEQGNLLSGQIIWSYLSDFILVVTRFFL